MKKKVLIAVCALALVVVVAIGGTVAWLTDKTDEVKNTFTYGDINITLAETTGAEYKIIPGNDIAKDPKVTVESGSEPCYLFVKVKESDNWPAQKTADNSARKVDYAIAEGWSVLENNAGVYYRVVDAVNSDTSYGILANNKIVVSEELNKEEVNALKSATAPTLTFTAYAVQRDSNIASAVAAWEIVNPTVE